MAIRKKRRKAGRPKGSKNKKRTAKKKGTRKKSKKKAAKRRSKKMPDTVIRQHAKRLKKNTRAAAIYRDVLGC